MITPLLTISELKSIYDCYMSRFTNVEAVIKVSISNACL